MHRFLDELHKFAEVSIFTAAKQDYADSILSHLDPGHKIKTRLYAHDCYGKVKDISLISRDPCRTIVVDDSPRFLGEAGSP